MATASALAIAAHLLVAEFTGLYRSWRGVSREREVFCTLFTWALALVVVGAIGLSTLGVSLAAWHGKARLILLTWAGSTTVLMVVTHSVLRGFKRAMAMDLFEYGQRALPPAHVHRVIVATGGESEPVRRRRHFCKRSRRRHAHSLQGQCEGGHVLEGAKRDLDLMSG